MKIFHIILIIILAVLFSGCSVMLPGGLVDASAPLDQNGYQALGEASGTETSTSFLIFQSNKPNKEFIERAMQKAVNKLDGDALVNVAWYHAYSNYFLFKKYRFTVEGTVVKRAQGAAPLAGSVRSQPQINMPLAPAQPPFNGLGFSLSRSGGAYHEARVGFFDQYGYYETQVSVGDFNSIRWNVYVKNHEKPYYFYPHISYAKLSRSGTEKVKIDGQEHKIEFEGFIRTIPITFNVGANGAQMEQISGSLPNGLNPYANFGLGYYITELGGSAGGDWQWSQFGYNFGLGLEYQVKPNMSMQFGVSRHSVFTGENYHYWDWSLGANFYRGE